MSHSLTFIVAGDPAQLTGGYVYDARIAAALRSQGWRIEVIGLGGSFPEPDSASARALNDALARQPNGTRVVIDGLAMGGLPEIVARHGKRLDLTALVHHPLADETGLDDAQRTRFIISETRALAAVHRIIATSAFTARRLADFDVAAERVAVVEPGVDAAPLAQGTHGDSNTTQRLLCVATLIPRKGHDVLIDALARLGRHDWQCDCIGALDRDLAHARAVTARILQHGLGSRVHLLGEREPEALDAAYQSADVFVLPSHYEGYGMVVSEALARGLPVITTTGGALAHTLPREAGLAVPPGDVAAFAEALRRWFDDPELRQRLRAGARQARATLKDWNAAGAAFADALLAHGEPASGRNAKGVSP
ncbi:Glycosyltransferase involved in cell wall bisynthesis [Modicisalibacter muralis]|uniref:Glycosyltransferase involved in cell wall bisynthesis n=1 Tax=Modicisalibacter muralis TaxID=119000 RepID=A0A1G9ELV1_9GAMM|nr:glycosyltransferase family 4 protein [Halomonas muralis]SDK77162.1 Glycosyltransferase involved in cell wall bisynthesis [Halomonas muralis]